MKHYLISYILESILKFIKSRVFIICTLFICLFGAIIYRLFDLQIVNESYYTKTYVQKAMKKVYSAGTRGEIKDRNGNVLAYNKLAYNVVIEDDLPKSSGKSDQLNDIIDQAVRLVTKSGDTLDYNFPITIDKNDNLSFTFTSDSAKKTFLINAFGKDIYEKDPEKYQNMSASEVYEYMVGEDKYDIDRTDRTTKDILNILCYRYNLSLNAYSKYIKTTIAKDVNDTTVAAIYENQNVLSGVSIAEDTIRVYNDSEYFAPIIGYTGKISEDELADYTAAGKDYINTDMVGKAGIEASMEDKLQGTKGYQNLFVDSTGNIVSVLDSKESTPGDDVYLSIDRDLQIATYNLLEQKIAGVLISNIVNRDVDKKAFENADKDNIQIVIPVKDVYFQLINNNIVDINSFKSKDATVNERNIYKKFTARQKQVLTNLKKQLADKKCATLKNTGDEYQDYQYYIYDLLKNNNILLTSEIDTVNDKYYQKYLNGSISIRSFLYHAISSNWINVSALESTSKYTDTDELYKHLTTQIVALLKKDKGFSKKIYSYMINDNTLSGCEVCMLLFDQKVIDYNKDQYDELAYGNTTTSYNFIIEQIRTLALTPAQIALDPCSGSVVITDPDNGQVRAMVTYPSYDNNLFSGTVDPDYWEKLTEDLSDPLYSRSTQTQLAPGSTFKMISAIAGLEEGALSSPSETILTTGEFDKVATKPKCWYYPSAHGSINVKTAIGVSCNVFFYEVGYRLGTTTDADGKEIFSNTTGIEKLKKYGAQFGLTSKSGIEITEKSPHFSTEDAVRSAIGQGSHGFTNVQLARYCNTLASKGTNYELTLIDKITDSKGKTTYKQESKITNQISIMDSTWDAVYEGMVNVTSAPGGTVSNVFGDLPYKVAGKTGTAQENKKRYDHALFVGFAPVDDPKYSMSVIIPYGNSSSYSAEVAHDVLKYLDGDLSLKTILKGKANTPTSEKVGD